MKAGVGGMPYDAFAQKRKRHPRCQAAQDFCQEPLCSVQPAQLYTLSLDSAECQHGSLSSSRSTLPFRPLSPGVRNS